MSNLGALYAAGSGVPQDYARSLDWYKQGDRARPRTSAQTDNRHHVPAGRRRPKGTLRRRWSGFANRPISTTRTPSNCLAWHTSKASACPHPPADSVRWLTAFGHARQRERPGRTGRRLCECGRSPTRLRPGRKVVPRRGGAGRCGGGLRSGDPLYARSGRREGTTRKRTSG